MRKLSLSDLDVSGRRVFMRVDFNVPMDGASITDDGRIRASLPSIRHVVENGGRLVLASHMGRPKGRREADLSLRPVGERLGELLGRTVGFAADAVGEEAARAVDKLENGNVLLLENLRFHAGEEKNDPEFARRLAALADVYVNDAFGTAHRAHASTEGIVAHVARAAAGFLMQQELEALGRAIDRVDHPYVAIVGGAKISGKIELIQSFMNIADDILIGGAMAYTFLRAGDVPTGRSLVEEDRLELAAELVGSARKAGRRIRLPVDHVVAKDLEGAGKRTIPIDQTGSDEMGLDIGPRTVDAYRDVISNARTVVWNGPMGVFEKPAFADGTLGVARAIADSPAFSIVGGGDSAAAVAQSGIADRINHISTGGGAALEYLSGQKLPGVEALTDAGS